MLDMLERSRPSLPREAVVLITALAVLVSTLAGIVPAQASPAGTKQLLIAIRPLDPVYVLEGSSPVNGRYNAKPVLNYPASDELTIDGTDAYVGAYLLYYVYRTEGHRRVYLGNVQLSVDYYQGAFGYTLTAQDSNAKIVDPQLIHVDAGLRVDKTNSDRALVFLEAS